MASSKYTSDLPGPSDGVPGHLQFAAGGGPLVGSQQPIGMEIRFISPPASRTSSPRFDAPEASHDVQEAETPLPSFEFDHGELSSIAPPPPIRELSFEVKAANVIPPDQESSGDDLSVLSMQSATIPATTPPANERRRPRASRPSSAVLLPAASDPRASDPHAAYHEALSRLAASMRRSAATRHLVARQMRALSPAQRAALSRARERLSSDRRRARARAGARGGANDGRVVRGPRVVARGGVRSVGGGERR